MLGDRLTPADEAARETDMRESLSACPRILDLVARGPLADPVAAQRLLQKFPVKIEIEP
jgi:fatty-acyl-CoA synthase